VKKVLRTRAHPQAWVPRVVGHGDDSDVSVMFHAGLQFSTVRLICATTIGCPVFPGGSIARLFRFPGSFHPAESTSRYPSNSFHSPSAVSGQTSTVTAIAFRPGRRCFSVPVGEAPCRTRAAPFRKTMPLIDELPPRMRPLGQWIQRLSAYR
jgi:hypothetical protein